MVPELTVVINTQTFLLFNGVYSKLHSYVKVATTFK
uniref:Uncharacterized protein n=1 Tax=Arundo donax TaxID=35708 RepID=A0A0A8YT29_ARUDO